MAHHGPVSSSVVCPVLKKRSIPFSRLRSSVRASSSSSSSRFNLITFLRQGMFTIPNRAVASLFFLLNDEGLGFISLARSDLSFFKRKALYLTSGFGLSHTRIVL